MSDYKYNIAEIAFQMAEDEYGQDYYELDGPTQMLIHEKASEEYWNNVAVRADAMFDAMMEGLENV